MRVLSIRFTSAAPLKDLESPFIEAASAIAAVPGMLSKVWINEGVLVGGLYLFRDQASLDAYLAGPIVAGITRNRAFSHFRIEQYDVLEELSAVTRGLPAVVAT